MSRLAQLVLVLVAGSSAALAAAPVGSDAPAAAPVVAAAPAPAPALAAAMAPAVAVSPASTAAPAGHVPKTVILGFDGMDFGLTKRFIDEGLMPHFKKLAEQGLFQKLDTSNPAQSPVSWAVFNTGSNPGKTGVAGFVSRVFKRDENGKVLPDGNPQPQMMLGFSERIPADDFVEHPLALNSPERFLYGAISLAALAGLLAGLILFKLLFRMSFAVAAVLSLLLAGGAAWGGQRWAQDYIDSLPADGKLPYVINPMQGTSFWSYLDKIGVRTRGIQIASTYPPDDEGAHTELLSGLGVMDVTGSPGAYSIYTNDEWTFDVKGTGSGGKIYRFFEDEPNIARESLRGPLNWFEQVRFATQLDAYKPTYVSKDGEVLPSTPPEIAEKIGRIKEDTQQWASKNEGRVTVPFSMVLDKTNHAIDFTVGEASPGGKPPTKFRVKQGEWSDFIPVEFKLSERYSAYGTATFHVVECDDTIVRVLVPPINIDPQRPPAQLPISAPGSFSSELVKEVGHDYETLGWACITNPIKDWDETHIPEQSFMDDMVSTEKLREELMLASLQRADDWDVFFQVFSTPDRVCHMLFRESDPEHPAYDKALADTKVNAWGQSFPLSEAIPKLYAQEDRLVGGVMDLIDQGKLGPDCLLVLVSDHGFTSFRRQVNLANWLIEKGYLVMKEGLDVTSAREQNLSGSLGQYVDWSKTRAYSMGLGEIYVNLAGREPKGIVPPAQYDEVVEAIRKDLLTLKDPKDGATVVTTASRRDALYNGRWWKEGMASRKVRGKDVPVPNDGFADIFLGFAPHYRVAWANTLGGLDEDTITDNTNHWSGDHVSVDPSHVPGILLSNRRFTSPSAASLLDLGPTVLQRYGIDPSAPHTEMDGHPLPFENVTR